MREAQLRAGVERADGVEQQQIQPVGNRPVVALAPPETPLVVEAGVVRMKLC